MITPCEGLLVSTRQDFVTFLHRSFQTVSPGEQFLRGWHIDAMAWHLAEVTERRVRRLIITVPPRSLKSICVSVAWPAFLLGQQPSEKIICASYAQELARKHGRDFRAVLKSPWYQEVFPGTCIDPQRNADYEIATTAQGFRLATSVEGTLTGRGGNLIIIDDPIKPGQVSSAAERRRVNDWYSSTVVSRLDNKNTGAIVIVMQRLHEDDLVGHVRDLDDWTQLRIPAIEDKKRVYRIGPHPTDIHVRRAGDALQPTLQNRASLEALRRSLGSALFEAQYQQSPLPSEGNLFRTAWFRTPERWPSRSTLQLVVQSWDTASSVATAGDRDYSVCTTWGVDDTNYYLLDVWRQRVEYPVLRRAVLEQRQLWRATHVLIEKAGVGVGLVQDLRQRAPGVIGIQVKGDKRQRAEAQTAPIEAGHVFLPVDAPWRAAFLDEMLAFPSGRHDDQVDSVSQFLSWITQRRRRLVPGTRPSGYPRPLGGVRPVGRLHHGAGGPHVY